MGITKKQIRRIVREAAASTKKYDDNKHLKGDQDELPDALQKGIIDKAEDEDSNEKNESKTFIKNRIRKIIREEIEQGEYDLETEDIDLLIDQEDPTEIEAKQDSWSGGQNIYTQIDHGEVAGAEAVTRGVETLKISESALRRLIRTSLFKRV